MNRWPGVIASIALVLSAASFFISALLFAHQQGQIEDVKFLRQARIADQARTDVSVCQRLNTAGDILADLLRLSAHNRAARGRPLTRSERIDLNGFLRRLEPADCADLPSVRAE